jgi:hypothetical protein
VVITVAWAVAFTLTSTALVVCVAAHAPTAISIAAHVLGLAAPTAFTSIYPARVQARLARNS